MDFQYNQGVSSDFKAMQAGFDAVEREKAGASTGKSETSSANSSFRSNKLRGAIFDTVADVMQPERKYIDQYRDLLRDGYLASARAELNTARRRTITRTNRPTYKGVGWAEGNRKGGLYREFDADVFVKIVKSKKGTLEINYEVEPDFSKAEWGKGLAEESSPKRVPFKSIYKWVRRKISNGHFKIAEKELKKIKNADGATAKSISKKKESMITGVSIAIMKSIRKTSKPPVIKDWYRIDKNKRLNMSFRKYVDKKGAYYRSQIRKSIIRNINAQK